MAKRQKPTKGVSKMAAKKTKADLEAMTAEERAAYEKRNEAARAPRPAYITYTVNEDGSINVHSTSRVAEDVLAAVDADRSLKYARILIK